MPIEGQVNNIADLNPAYPQADDPVSQGDNHVRLIKKALKDTFPNIDGTVMPSEDELNQLVGKDLSGDISGLEVRVSKNEADIANNASAIQSAEGAIVANTNYIKDVEVIAVNNESEIAGHETRITKNEQDISSLQGQVGSNDSDISSLNSRVSKNEADISTNKTNISKNASDISALQGQVGSNDSDISSLSGRVSKNESDISSLSGRVSKNESDITSVSQLAQTNQLNISNINTYLNDQDLNDLKDVNTSGATEGYVLGFVGGKWVPIEMKGGGGMIKIVDQPSNVGDFSLEPTQMAYVANVQGSTSSPRSYTLIVPNGMVFAFEYMFAIGYGSIELNNLVIDGVNVLNGGSLDYSTSGGPTWPGSDKSSIIMVEDRMSVSWLPDNSSTSQLFLAGMFAEA